MTDKPKIEVGQRWNTRGGNLVRVLHIEDDGESAEVSAYPITVRGSDNPYSVDPEGRSGFSLSPEDLISLAPQTIKREVALYQWKKTAEPGVESSDGRPFCAETTGPQHPSWRRISEPLTIEFTLLPGESA
jgi:hypothetical protein